MSSCSSSMRSLNRVVLHSFAHLADTKAPPDFAEAFLTGLSQRLRGAGYQVMATPFGFSCGWELSVYADPVAKVYKSV